MFDNNDDWGEAQSTRDETKNTGTWIRLKDGEKALMVFPVPPFAYRQVWLQSENRSEIFDADKHDGLRPQGRFAFPVFEPITGAKEYDAKIFDVSGETFDKIVACRKKYGAGYLYEVTRVGSGTDTQYQVLPERELKKKEIEYLKKQTLLDAEALTVGDGSANSPDAPASDDPWADDE